MSVWFVFENVVIKFGYLWVPRDKNGCVSRKLLTKPYGGTCFRYEAHQRNRTEYLFPKKTMLLLPC